MSNDRYPITPDGFEKIREELKRLIRIERPKVIAMIAYARSLGDLSENAEYDTAKDRQGFIEARISDLEVKVARSEVIDPSKIVVTDRVVFGVHVTLEDADTGDTVIYQIVGAEESAPESGRISITSPIGRALIGKLLDDEVTVRTPGGIRELIVLEVKSSRS